MALAISILLAVFVLEEPWNWVAVAAGATFEAAETSLLIWWSKRRRVAVGTETLVGRQRGRLDRLHARRAGPRRG